MLRRQHRILRVIGPNRVDIILTDPARQVRRAKLPKTIIRDPCRIHHRHLPRQLRSRMIMRKRRAILLQHHGLAHTRADAIVLADPRAAPRVIVPPRVRVQMEGAVVERGDAQVRSEVDADVAAVGVATVTNAVSWCKPALIAERHHVRAVEGLDIGAGVGGPVGDDGGGAALAARLVAELPGEDGGGILVAVDDRLDV